MSQLIIKDKKNNKLLILSIILAIIFILSIGGYFAYSKGSFENILGISNKIPVGTYSLIEMSSSETVYSKEEIEALKAFGLNITLEIRDDGTGIIDMAGDTNEFTYDSKNITIEDETVPYTFKDKKISFEKNGEKLVFEKKD